MSRRGHVGRVTNGSPLSAHAWGSLGVSYLATIAPFGFDFDPPEFLRAYRSLGAKAAQFYRNEANPPTVDEAVRAATDAGVPFDSIHGLFGEHIDPTSPDAAERARCVGVFREEGQLAAELVERTSALRDPEAWGLRGDSSPIVVVHPSAWNPGRREMSYEEAEDAQEPRWAALGEFLAAMADVGRSLGVVYAIENQPRNCPLGHDAFALACAVRDIASPFIRMCLDTGHAHITGDVVEGLRSAGDVVAYLHVHDNDATIDDHRVPGEGTIDWSAFASMLRERGIVAPRMLEVFLAEGKVREWSADVARRADLRRMLAIDDADVNDKNDDDTSVGR